MFGLKQDTLKHCFGNFHILVVLSKFQNWQPDRLSSNLTQWWRYPNQESIKFFSKFWRIFETLNFVHWSKFLYFISHWVICRMTFDLEPSRPLSQECLPLSDIKDNRLLTQIIICTGACSGTERKHQYVASTTGGSISHLLLEAVTLNSEFFWHLLWQE